MNRKKRFAAACAALLLVLALLCSKALVIAESDHRCSGDGCAVCHQIQVCLRLLDQGGTAGAPAACAAAVYLVVRALRCRPQLAAVCSPVELRVKLLN